MTSIVCVVYRYRAVCCLWLYVIHVHMAVNVISETLWAVWIYTNPVVGILRFEETW